MWCPPRERRRRYPPARLNYFFAAAAMPLLLNGLLMGQIQDVLVLLCVPADLSHRIVLLDLRAAACRPSI